MGYLGHLGPFWLYGFSVGSMYEMIIEDEYDPKIKNQFCVIDSCCFSDSAKLRWKRAIRSFNFISKVSFQLRLLKGWLGIAKLKPLVERYSCQPMRRLDTSNNLSVGPSCM